MRLERIATDTGAILYDPQRFTHPGVQHFDPARLPTDGAVIRAARGRGSAWFLPPLVPGGPELALRRYRRGGLVGRCVEDRYLYLGAERTRSFRELRLLAHLEDVGLPAARPVGALFERAGAATYRAALLTVRISGARPLSMRLGQMPAELWHRLGATLGAFHAAGIFHADLNAHNILIDAEEAVHLIDFDRGEQRTPGPWAAENIARLARSLQKLGGPDTHSTEWRVLLEGYETPRSAPRR